MRAVMKTGNNANSAHEISKIADGGECGSNLCYILFDLVQRSQKSKNKKIKKGGRPSTKATLSMLTNFSFISLRHVANLYYEKK